MANQIIGRITQARRNLNIFITPVRSILPNESNSEPIQSESDDDLIEETQVLFDVRTPFARSYSTLLEHHKKLEALLSKSPEAQQQFDQYARTNGDYTQELDHASDLLFTLDSIIDQMMAVGRSRGLPMADPNDEILTSTTAKSIQLSSHPRPAISTLASTPSALPPSIHQSTAPIPQPSNANADTDQNQIVYLQNDPISAFVTANLIGKNLPHFTGEDILAWPEFHESFLSLIKHGRITGADKLSLLKMCLSEEAQEIIAGLPKLDHNYEQAMLILQKYYDKPHLRNHALLSRLRTLPSCDQEGRNLRSFYLKLNILIHQLLPNGELESPGMLVHLVTSKLPIAMQTRIIKQSARKADFGVYNVMSILADAVEEQKIEQEIMANDQVEAIQYHRPCSPQFNDHSSNPISAPTHLFTNQYSRNCRLCNGPHFEQYCTEYTTPRDRATVVMQRQLCANCLAQGHETYKCRNHGRCHKCSGLHHTSICSQA